MWAVAAVLAAVVFEKASYQQEANDDLVWRNVEALATGEIDHPEGRCYGSGTVKCPDTGDMVKYALGKKNL